MNVEMPRPQVAERVARAVRLAGAGRGPGGGHRGCRTDHHGGRRAGRRGDRGHGRRGAGLHRADRGRARARRACVQLLGRYAGHRPHRRAALGQPAHHARAGSPPGSATTRPTSLKVNDADGNPIEIAAVVVWQVEDTAQALLRGRRLRGVRRHPDRDRRPAHRQQLPLRRPRRRAAVAARQRRRDHRQAVGRDRAPGSPSAGVRVIESRITRLAYAPEIAQAMLRRQQADAVVAARQPHRRGRGRHGRAGPGPARRATTSSSWTRSARPPWSATCWSCCAATGTPSRSSTPAPSTTERAPIGRRRAQEASCCGSTPPSTTRWPAGPATSCAAPTRRSSSCCGAAPRRGRPAAPRRRPDARPGRPSKEESGE